MGKCQNWTDQWINCGDFGEKCSSGKEGVDGGQSHPRDVFSLAPSDGSPCLRRLPPCQSFLFTTSTHHWDSESHHSANNWLSRHFLRARSSLGQACLAVYHWRKLVLASCLRVYHWLALFRGSVPLASIVLFTGKAGWACQLVAANSKQVNKAGHWRRANTNIAGWPGRVGRRSGWLFRRGRGNVGGFGVPAPIQAGLDREDPGSPGAGLLPPDAQPLPPTH